MNEVAGIHFARRIFSSLYDQIIGNENFSHVDNANSVKYIYKTIGTYIVDSYFVLA